MVEPYVRARAATYRAELFTTEAVAERATESAREAWLGSGTSGTSPGRIVDVLTCAARKLLHHSGTEMLLHVNREEPGREILQWRYVSLALPPSVLIAAATPLSHGPAASVRLLHGSIAPDGPVAQQHVHYAAMMSFEHLWASLRVRALLEPATFLRSIRSERARCPGLHAGCCIASGAAQPTAPSASFGLQRARHLTAWADLLAQAFVGQRVLDQHACHHPVELAACPHATCVKGRLLLHSLINGRSRHNRSTHAPYPWANERYQLQRRLRAANAPALRGRTAHQSRPFYTQLAAEERDIVVRAFEYVRLATADSLYEQLFLQYLRVKTALYGVLTQSPGKSGLTHFVSHFQQVKVYAPERPSLRPIDHNETGLRVEATERRVSPDAWPELCERWDAEADPLRVEPRGETAWLVHFQRQRPNRRARLPLFGAEIRAMKVDAERIARALTVKPARLRRLRGLDLCGVEADQPLWVSAEILREVRSRSAEIAARRPGWALQPLRLTIHAGEDFTYLTSGVRAIAEPFQWRLIQRGDRIGHGTAITFDPRVWWGRQQGRVFEVTTFDRLLDLAFLASYTGNSRDAQQHSWLTKQIKGVVQKLNVGVEAIGQQIPDSDVVSAAVMLWDTLGGSSIRHLFSKRHPSAYEPTAPEGWVYQYLWNRSTQDLAREPMRLAVDCDGGDATGAGPFIERDLLVIARERLIKEVARWQVCIETNPSSNLIVGGLDAMGAAQDFLQQRSTIPGRWTLPWTISTDDPITFSTTLADEYAYAWAGMVLRDGNPYDPSYARSLLDEAAATSMRTRFSLPYEQTGSRTRRTRPH